VPSATTEVSVPPEPPSESVRRPRLVTDVPSRVDRWYNRITLSAGLLVLALLAFVGLFLLLRSQDAISRTGIFDFLTKEGWRTDTKPPHIGVLGLLVGTVTVAVIAVTIAIPFAVLAALCITEYATAKWRKYLTGLVDLLAAVPSLIFGLWGFLYLSQQLVPLERWISDNFGAIPIFEVDKGSKLSGSPFIAGVVVSLMVFPIVASVVREVFAQTPQGEKEAALALGSTRWGMIRAVVLPYGRGGIIGGAMLGLGRALGETIAVRLILGGVPFAQPHVLQNGAGTIAGFIATRAGGDPFTVSGLMAAGLVLFILTLATNMIASVVVSRSRSGVGVDL
jgi:phosphate transport system permease protein